MNKFNFISNETPVHHVSETIAVEKPKEVTKERKLFHLDFTGTVKRYEPIFEGRRVQPIVKSDIQESLKLQLKNIFKMLSEKEIDFFEMNSQTKQKFRMFLCYETDYVPKGEKNKSFVGNIFGIPIAINENVVDSSIVACIKIKNILKTDFFNKGALK